MKQKYVCMVTAYCGNAAYETGNENYILHRTGSRINTIRSWNNNYFRTHVTRFLYAIYSELTFVYAKCEVYDPELDTTASGRIIVKLDAGCGKWCCRCSGSPILGYGG